MSETYGPKLKNAQNIYKTKYLSSGESFKDGMSRIAHTLSLQEPCKPKKLRSSPSTTTTPNLQRTVSRGEKFLEYRELLLEQVFLPAGRIQAAVGATRQTTPFNCYVSGTIEDSMTGIMDRAKDAALTMKLGGGIGYDFSTIRPNGSNIRTIDSSASGPLSYMEVFDAVCSTVASAGHRRGAQMAVLRVDHPDIEEYVHAKNNDHRLTNFNTSIGITDEFMTAVEKGLPFDLVFNERVYKTIDARALWEAIMRSTWDWAEPGVLFIDRINTENNLWYCETIAATNPCGEQPLPPYGACLLGSINLVKFVSFPTGKSNESKVFMAKKGTFDYDRLKEILPTIQEMVDNVIDVAEFPLEEQKVEAESKRRMGIGVTGLANAGEALGYKYGSEEFITWMRKVLKIIRDGLYRASVEAARKKGPFPAFVAEEYLKSPFIKRLPKDIREGIKEHGIRNSHLLSIAPTGTISMAADNVSSGLEPPFLLEYEATINFPTGVEKVRLQDYAFREWGIVGVTADELDAMAHVKVLCAASYYIDSACSKTCNVGEEVTFEEFKDLYLEAYRGGAKGCTTFRAAGKRFGVRNAIDNKEEDYAEGTACYIDPNTGQKECS